MNHQRILGWYAIHSSIMIEICPNGLIRSHYQLIFHSQNWKTVSMMFDPYSELRELNLRLNYTLKRNKLRFEGLSIVNCKIYKWNTINLMSEIATITRATFYFGNWVHQIFVDYETKIMNFTDNHKTSI